MTTFFYIAGITVTLLGILAIAVLFCVFVYVRILGYPLHLYFKKDCEEEENQESL